MPFPLAISQSQPTHAHRPPFHGSFASLFTIALLYVLATNAFAQSPATSPPQPASQTESVADPWLTDRFYLETSLYTHHFSYDAAHVDKQKLILGEWNITEQWLVGASVFDNSFGQSSQYVYGGWRNRPFEDVRASLTATGASIATRSRLMVPGSRQSSFHRPVFAFRESARRSSCLAAPVSC